MKLAKVLPIAWAVCIGIIGCLGMAGCNNDVVPPTSRKVITNDATDITDSRAVLHGATKIDIRTYESMEIGFMLSDNLQDMDRREGECYKANAMVGDDFTIEIHDLPANTPYYYCAFVLLNDIRYEFGQIKTFTTLPSGSKAQERTATAHAE